jgi:hypothetical protein
VLKKFGRLCKGGKSRHLEKGEIKFPEKSETQGNYFSTKVQHIFKRKKTKLRSFPDLQGPIFKIVTPKKWLFRFKLLLFWAEKYHNIGFQEERHFVCRKLVKIAKNCDHNIDPELLIINLKKLGRFL